MMHKEMSHAAFKKNEESKEREQKPIGSILFRNERFDLL